MMNLIKESYFIIKRATLDKIPANYSVYICIDANVDKSIKDKGRVAIDDILEYYKFIEKGKNVIRPDETDEEKNRKMNSTGTYTIMPGTQPENIESGRVKWQYKLEDLSYVMTSNLMNMINQLDRFEPGYIQPETNSRNNSGYMGKMAPKLKSDKNN